VLHWVASTHTRAGFGRQPVVEQVAVPSLPQKQLLQPSPAGQVMFAGHVAPEGSMHAGGGGPTHGPAWTVGRSGSQRPFAGMYDSPLQPQYVCPPAHMPGVPHVP